MRFRSALLAALLAAPPLAADPVSPPVWPFDELALANGSTLHGLLIDDLPQGVRFQVVRRAVGRPTVTLTLWFERAEVSAVKKLPDADRAALREKIAALDQGGGGERTRMDALELTAADWPGRPGAARQYSSDQFVLISGASDEVTRRAAVRLEQITTAFARFLRPRVAGASKTTVYLAGTAAEYRALLGPAAGPVLNPAVYDPAGHRIVCGSDLRRLGDDLTAARVRHAQQLAGIDRYEADVRHLYKGSKPDLDRFLLVAADQRKRVRDAERANDRAFDAATARLFALLYHETFHAYAGTFVYPTLPAAEVRAGKGTGRLPRWLNEGLAQIFETAVVEAGELRVGQADKGRVANVHALLAGKPVAPGGPAGLVPVADLLRADRNTFLATHRSAQGESDRAYLTAWAVAAYLAFDRGLVGTAKFDAYLAAVNGGADPVAAFEALVGQDVPAFEAALRAYLGRLLPDGTLRPAEGGKKT